MQRIGIAALIVAALWVPGGALATQAVDCADFASPADTQLVLDADPADPNGLDPDRDGIACEALGADAPPAAPVVPAPAPAPGGGCDPSYHGVCVPPFPPDLDCGQVGVGRFQVVPPDPHGFDGDGDGIGCESN